MYSRNHSAVAYLLLILPVCCLTCSIGLGAETPEADQVDLARRILADTEVEGGVIVHVGCGDGKLTAALAADEGYLVHGLDANPENINKARRNLRSLGLSAGRVSVNRFDGQQLPLIDNMVNLVVAEALDETAMKEALRVLCPGGVAYVGKNNTWAKTVKPRPKGIDDWTHLKARRAGSCARSTRRPGRS